MSTSATLTDVTLHWPTTAQVWEVLTLQSGYNTCMVILATTLLGLASSTIGSYAVLRKRALVSDALAHSALPGIGAAFIFSVIMGGSGKNLLVLLAGATISGIIGVLTMQAILRYSRLGEDVAIGTVLSSFFGVGVVLLSIIQSFGTGNEGGLQHFIYGQTAAMGTADAHMMAVLAAGAIFVSLLVQKEFQLVCFDSTFAEVQGWPVGKIDLLMMVVVIAVTVVGLQAVGMLLIVALIIVPPAAARFWTERLSTMVLLAAVIGGSSGYLGSAVSALFPRLPAGAVIVLTAGVMFMVSFLFAPRRGLLGSTIRQFYSQYVIVSDHICRALYELGEKTEKASTRASFSQLARISGHSLVRLYLVVCALQMAGYLSVRWGAGSCALTERGIQYARQLTRNHRLWEEYIVTFGHIATSHVDYSADRVEHVLSPEIIAALEESLRERGKKLSETAPPESLHPLPT